MVNIKTCATSANIGPGFDCLGLALDIYNSFDVEISDKDELINIEDRFNNEDNLFLKSYRQGIKKLNIDDHIKVKFNSNIPISRGLGSSSSLIVGGLKAASVLHNNGLSDEEIFDIAANMEGHPDNVAPCIFGGLTASFKANDHFIYRSLPLSKDLIFTLLIPDFEVSTAEARKVLPSTYERKVAVNNSAKALLLTNAIKDGDITLLKQVSDDEIHEPYRKKLIHDYDEIKDIFKKQTDGVLFISGSGSTCLGISKKELEVKELNFSHHWDILRVNPVGEIK